MRQVAFLSSPQIWQHGHGPDHPLKPERLQRTHMLLQEYGGFESPNVSVVAPRPATQAELNLFHTNEYLQVVRSLSMGSTSIRPWDYGFGPGDNPIFPGMYESEGLKVGSAIQAAELLVAGNCQAAFSYAGGLHHAGPEIASGFCVFNDAAVAIHWLLQHDLRVAYVDIDVHHGDGVQNAFYTSDRVLTISLHQDGRTLFPGTGFINEIGVGKGHGFSVNIPLPPYTDGAAYLYAFDQIVPPLVDRFSPDIIVTQLGVDTHWRDPLANLALTTQDHLALFKRLSAMAPHWLALGGGGYALDVVPRSWALAFGIMAQLPLPDSLPPRYQEMFGGDRLHDLEAVILSESVKDQVHDEVRRLVQVIQETHNL